jgi:hypothetical protein
VNPEGYCWPLVSTLTKVTELGRTKLFLAFRELESLGVIDRRMLISRLNGRNAPTLFRVGGKVTYLPKNAERYILANKRKPKSRATKRLRSPRVVDFARMRGPQSMEGGSPQCVDGGSPPCMDIEVSIEAAAPIEAADAVAFGSAGGGDRGKRVLESVNSHHRHPPSEPTAKSDDDDSRARHNSPAAKATTKPAEPVELRKIKIEGFKSTALARIEAKYPNQFSRDYLYLAFAAFESRTDARISGPGFFVTCFENESDRSNEIAIETNVGAGPEIPEPSFCQQCDKTRTFHNRSIANIRRDDPKWIDHAFVNRDEIKAG